MTMDDNFTDLVVVPALPRRHLQMMMVVVTDLLCT